MQLLMEFKVHSQLQMTSESKETSLKPVNEQKKWDQFSIQTKCAMKQKGIKYNGNVAGAVGVKPDPSEVIVIKVLQPLKDKQEPQSFLGMVNYLT